VARGESVPLQAEPADGTLTALPAAVYLLAGKTSVLLFTDPPAAGQPADSVELARVVEEEVPRVRVELHRPPWLGARASSGRRPRPGQAAASAARGQRRDASRSLPALQVLGSFEAAARLNLVIAPERELFACGVAAALARQASASQGRAPAPVSPPRAVVDERTATPAALQARTREEIAACRESLLVSEGGTCGLRLFPGEELLSTSAGAGLAALLPALFPGEEEMEELALRLADFALRSQLPSGLFYERYDLRRSSWLEGDGKKARAPAMLPGQSADTARSLLVLAAMLRRRRVPHARYLHAAARAVGALSAAAAAGAASEEEALALVEPLAELYLLTGKDAHKKSLAGIRDRFFAEAREPAAADALQPLLLRARAAAALADVGFALKGQAGCLHSLLPWIHLNPGDTGVNPCGGLHEALGSGRLLFRGFELSHLLARLAARQPLGALSLRALLPQLLAFTLRQPAGISYLSLTEPGARALGPVDSRILVRELTARHRLLEDFPQYFPRTAARAASSPAAQQTRTAS
jgi:hypothetical protein